MEEFIISSKYNNNEILDGKKTYNSIQAAFEDIVFDTTIYLQDEIYFGQIKLDKPNVTIIGSKKSIIAYDAHNGEIVREIDGGDGIKTYGTTGSTTFLLTGEARNFTMKNVTVKNSYERVDSKGTQAVAFKTEAENGYYINCSFISTQDTLYVNGNDNFFQNCKIVGDVDFIFGSGNAIFDKCQIHAIKLNKIIAYITAPNTKEENEYGFLLYKCDITSEDTVCLGRPWYPNAFGINPATMYYECLFPPTMDLKYVKMRETDPDNHNFFYYNCRLNNDFVSNTKEVLARKYQNYYNEMKKI